MNLEKLKDKFSDDDLEWRVQRVVGKNKDSAIVVPYVTNRAIMDRLDEVCGAGNWTNSFVAGPAGGVVCTLGVRTEQGWVFKSDGAENSDIEPVKGGLSNSMKRAAVHWGIGRYLYSLPTFFVKATGVGENYQKDFGNWNPPKLNGKAEAKPYAKDTKSPPLPREQDDERPEVEPQGVADGPADFF